MIMGIIFLVCFCVLLTGGIIVVGNITMKHCAFGCKDWVWDWTFKSHHITRVWYVCKKCCNIKQEETYNE